MKNIYLLIVFSMLCIGNVMAQMTTPIRVKAGEDLYEKLAKEIYLYPSFTKGVVSFRDGRLNQAYLNYNMLNGEIQFIDQKRDTLSLANELTIKYVNIAKDSFYYSDGYVELIFGNESAKLAVKQIIRVIDQEKIGAYDQPTSTASITSFNSITSDLKTFKLDVRQDVIMDKQTTFYIGDRYNNFFKANKKNLLKYFSKKEKELNNFIKDNNINFEKEEDLIKIVNELKNY